MNTTASEKAKRIRLLMLDVDGVLTDGRLFFAESGEALKVFNTLDGHGIKLLQRTGIEVGIITGRNSPMVAQRAKDLGVAILQQGREDKLNALNELLVDRHTEFDRIAFMGDDYPDLSVMTRVGLALAPSSAHPEVKRRAHWCSEARGGEGAVREACDWIMQAQQTYQQALQHYL